MLGLGGRNGVAVFYGDFTVVLTIDGHVFVHAWFQLVVVTAEKSVLSLLIVTVCYRALLKLACVQHAVTEWFGSVDTSICWYVDVWLSFCVIIDSFWLLNNLWQG